MSITLDKHQVSAVEGLYAALKQYGGALDGGDVGCHGRGEKILLYDGSVKNVEDIVVGDSLMGWDGTPREVLGLSSGIGELVTLIPIKGDPLVLNMDHILTLVRTNSHPSRADSRLNGQIIDISIRELLSKNKTFQDSFKLFRSGAPFSEKKLPVDPYLLGVLLGDGCLRYRRFSITTPDEEILSYVERACSYSRRFINTSKCPGIVVKDLSVESGVKMLGLKDSLSGNKFIPTEYKTGSRTQRLEILAGLLDTDGCLSNGTYDYVSKSLVLANDVAFVARSLGLAAYIKPCHKGCQTGAVGLYYRVHISGHVSIIPCKVPRKIAPERRQKKDVLRTGFSISPRGVGEFFGFTLSGDGRFLMGDFTVTHNTGKSVTFLGLCKKTGARPAIVTRKVVIPAWRDLCEKMGVNPLFIENYEALLKHDFPFCLKDVVGKRDTVTGEIVRTTRKFKDWQLPDNRVIFCFDEAQALRNPKSFASQAALGASKKYKTVLLSATPFQTPIEAQTIGAILRLFAPSGAYPWMLKHGCYKSVHGGLEFIGNRADKSGQEKGTNARRGAEIMAGINAAIFPSRGVRTRREEIPGFPESVIRAELIETGEASVIQKFYLQELAEARAADHAKACAGVDADFHELVEVLPVTVNLRLRQEIELLKVGAIVELAKNAADAGERVCIFVNFDATIECLKRLLDTELVIRGSKQGKDMVREHAVQAFQSNNYPYIIINNQAGGAGLSLHDPIGKAPRTSLICPPFSAVSLRQIQGRVWRRGGGFSTQKILFTSGTLEEKMRAKLLALNMNLDALLDADLDIKTYDTP